MQINIEKPEDVQYIFEGPQIYWNLMPKEKRVLARLSAEEGVLDNIGKYFKKSLEVKITVKG